MQMTISWSKTARCIAVVSCGLLLQSCISSSQQSTRSEPPVSQPPPIDLLAIPDAVPRVEPLSTRGNPAFYEVMGKRYFVQQSAAGYVERGVASWYGPGFHQAATSSGERYDMYAMTAAHKTLPLPSYVQVTNLSNGKSVVVRVNDRGPFKDGRIIDLSFTAAARLDMQRAGTALVEVRAITPGQDAPRDNDSIKTMYVQAGAFGTAANADKLAIQLRDNGYPQAQVRTDLVAGRSLYRVRIGPIIDVPTFDRIVTRLKTLGIADAHLALD
jgi:peptidoglycan lytic transglycosylase